MLMLVFKENESKGIITYSPACYMQTPGRSGLSRLVPFRDICFQCCRLLVLTLFFLLFWFLIVFFMCCFVINQFKDFNPVYFNRYSSPECRHTRRFISRPVFLWNVVRFYARIRQFVIPVHDGFLFVQKRFCGCFFLYGAEYWSFWSWLDARDDVRE